MRADTTVISILLGAARILKKCRRKQLPKPAFNATCRRWWWWTQNGGGRGPCGTVWTPGRALDLRLAQDAAGSSGSIPGPMLAAADRFELLVEGTGGHAAARMPKAVVCDPIVTALQRW